MPTPPPNVGQRLRDNWLELLLLLVLLIALVWLATVGRGVWQRVQPEPTPPPAALDAQTAFDGQRALGLVSFLTALGPRVAGSAAHDAAAERIEQELRDNGWQVVVQDFQRDGAARRNIVAKAGVGDITLLATHYDSSPVADLDPANQLLPAPAANDGGSSAAVLLELARSLDQQRLAGEVWLAFLDGQYSPQGALVSEGAPELAALLPPDITRRGAVWLDLVGGAEASFSVAPDADPALHAQLWDLASQLGYTAWFKAEPGASLELGQTALSNLGMPSAVIADTNYPFWRTLQDTPDKLSAESLGRVGQVLQAFLERAAS